MSYFPTDIPFMSDKEMRENGIRIPGDVSDTNVGNTDDYIRRQDAVGAIGEEYTPRTDFERGMVSQMSCDKAKIKALPPADVVPVVHSRWIKTADGAECENCGREAVYQIVDDHWEYEPYCPHCGAIMDNKKGNENG